MTQNTDPMPQQQRHKAEVVRLAETLQWFCANKEPGTAVRALVIAALALGVNKAGPQQCAELLRELADGLEKWDSPAAFFRA